MSLTLNWVKPRVYPGNLVKQSAMNASVGIASTPWGSRTRPIVYLGLTRICHYASLTLIPTVPVGMRLLWCSAPDPNTPLQGSRVRLGAPFFPCYLAVRQGI